MSKFLGICDLFVWIRNNALIVFISAGFIDSVAQMVPVIFLEVNKCLRTKDSNCDCNYATIERSDFVLLLWLLFLIALDEVHNCYCKRVGLFLQIFCWTVCDFLLDHSLTSQMTFSSLSLLILSDLYCSHSTVKLVANIKLFYHIYRKVLIACVASASGYGSGVQWFDSRRVKNFSTRLSFKSNSSDISRFMLSNSRHQPLRRLLFMRSRVYNSKNLNCWGAVVFVKDLFTHFLDCWSPMGVDILVTPKQEVERKSMWFCGVNCFLLLV